MPLWCKKGLFGVVILLRMWSEIDACGRAISRQLSSPLRTPSSPQWPCFLFLDIAAAFPSPSWEFLWRVLTVLGMPKGLFQVMQALYVGVNAWIRVRAFTFLMGPLWSGVNQGCPASAVLFVMAIDPTLRLLKAQIEDRSKGVFRACADDVGGMINDLAHLPL
eukprot:10947698-Karenia_brevis.AAC.1